MSKFEFNFTEDQVIELLHGNNEANQWYEAMEEILPYYEINTVNRVAGFFRHNVVMKVLTSESHKKT